MFTIGKKLQNLIPLLFITTSRISYFVCLIFNNFVAYKHQYHNRPVKDRYWFKKKKTTYKDHCNKSTIQEESSWFYVVQSHNVVTRLAFVQWQNKYAKCQFTWLTICPMYRLRQKFLPQKCLRLHDKQCTHYYSTIILLAENLAYIYEINQSFHHQWKIILKSHAVWLV